MSLDSHLNGATLLLGRKKTADDHRVLDFMVFEKFSREVLEFEAKIQSSAVAFIVDS